MNIAMANAVLRTVGLGSRFLLAMFMARFMTLEDIGVFALLAGAAGLFPSVAGLGLNFFMARSMVGIEHDEALGIVRERLAISVLAGTLFSALLYSLVNSGFLDLPISPWLAIAILMLELLGFDLQIALIARSRSTFANLLLFFRNGAWAIPFMLLAAALPSLRTIEALAWCWLGGIAISHLLLVLRYRADFQAAFGRVRSPRAGFVSSVGSSAAKIYLSDLGLAGSVYLDRFIITSLEDIRTAGIYFFYASIVNSAYVICLAATVQIYQPQLRSAFQAGGIAGLRDALRTRFRSTAMFTSVALTAAAPATYAAALVTGKAEIIAAFDVVPVLLAAFGVKMLSDFMSVALAAAEKDLHYALFNLAGLVLTIAGCLITIPAMGILGAAVAALASAMILLLLRVGSWRQMEAKMISERGVI